MINEYFCVCKEKHHCEKENIASLKVGSLQLIRELFCDDEMSGSLLTQQ
jgi:hypothetical protein